MHCHQLGAIRKRGFHLHIVNHIGARQNLRAVVHDLGHLFAVQGYQELGMTA